MAIVYLSLGSNLGDRVSFIQQSVSMLGLNDAVNIIASSSFYESEPWQMDSDNWFVNAVVQISTTLSPEALLDECHRIEAFLGRKHDNKSETYTDRNIDIDILFYDSMILKTDKLVIPHRQFHRRAFTLIPMLEIAEDFVHPLLGKTVEELFDAMENPEVVCLYGTRV